MYAAFEKCLRQTFAPDEKCMRPLKNFRAEPLRLMRNVRGLLKNGAKNKERKKSEIKIKKKQLNNHKFQRNEN